MSDLNERDIEALFAGRSPDGLQHLAVLVGSLRREASLPADPATARDHVAAAAAAARETPAPMPTPGRPACRLWRRRTVFAGLLSTIVGKVFVGAVALAAAAAGAGAAGVLPDPVQSFVDGNQEIRRITEQIRDQEQQQTQDQEQFRDREQGQGDDTTGTTTQQQQQQQQGPGDDTTGTTTQQQQQQQQGQGDDQSGSGEGDAPGGQGKP